MPENTFLSMKMQFMLKNVFLCLRKPNLIKIKFFLLNNIRMRQGAEGNFFLSTSIHPSFHQPDFFELKNLILIFKIFIFQIFFKKYNIFIFIIIDGAFDLLHNLRQYEILKLNYLISKMISDFSKNRIKR